MKIGVLALQGAFAAHQDALGKLGVAAPAVRNPEQLGDVDALVMPGGESTTMSKLLLSSGLFEPLAKRIEAGFPVFGTCAGMILLGHHIADGRHDQRSFAAIDIDVQRNGYGRQLASFEGDLDVVDLDGKPIAGGPFRGVFIRAPKVTRIGADVETLASWHGEAVLVRSRSVMAASFHPELCGDSRIHELFVDLVNEAGYSLQAFSGSETT